MTKYLYRKTKLAAMLTVAAVGLCVTMQAQYYGTPQPERKTPRALGVLETFKNGSRRLIPVTFFYERHYYDAGLYHATPVPFTLYSETEYEVEQFGKPMGTFTVRSASRAGEDEWFGNGRFRPALDEAALARRRRPAKVVVEDPSKPVLHRREGSEGDNPSEHPTETATQSPAEDDPDRPRLHRREDSGSGTTASGNTGSNAGSSTSAGGGTAPTTVASKNGAGVAAASEPTPSDESDHPILRRGKPIEEQSGPDLPEFKKEQGGKDLPDFQPEEPVARQVAVSDAGPSSSSENQELIYVCREPERRQLEIGARELAKAELRRLAAHRGLVLPGAVKASAAKKRSAAANAPGLTFEDEKFVPYDLDYNDFATVVFSARYTPPAASASAAKRRSWVVTVVAREDSDLKLVKLYSAVSDPRELDLYPEVKLVDAVDPDGYGRHALLFREQKRDGVSWLLGRPTGYELETLFETAVR